MKYFIGDRASTSRIPPLIANIDIIKSVIAEPNKMAT